MTVTREATAHPPQSAPRPGRLARAGIAGWLVVVLAATLVEAGIALRWLEIGPGPGKEPALRGVLFLLMTAALLGGGLVFGRAGVGAAVRDVDDPAPSGGMRLLGAPELGLVPLCAAAFFVAHYFSYDAYYAPTLRRFSTNIPFAMVVFIGCWAVLAAVGLRVRWAKRPAAVAVALLLLTVWMAVIVGGSH